MSDGTSAGTTKYFDPTPAVGVSSNPGNYLVAGDRFFFTGDDAQNRPAPVQVIWSSTGAPIAPSRFFELPDSAAPNFAHLAVGGGYLYFAATDAVRGREPGYVSLTDPQDAEIKDLVEGLVGSVPNQIVIMNDKAYMSALARYTFPPLPGVPPLPPVFVVHLYEVIGGVAGGWTNLGATANVPLDMVRNLTVVPGGNAAANALYFSAKGEVGQELYLYQNGILRLVTNIRPDPEDGPVQSSDPHHLTAAGGLLYFSADDGLTGQELWRSDGTQAGTIRLTNLNPAGDSNPSGLKARPADQTLFFAIDDGSDNPRLWQSNGLPANTVAVADAAGYSHRNPTQLSFTGGRDLFFSSQGTLNGAEKGQEPWVFRPNVGLRIGDYSWNDTNRNGIQDPDEAGRQGVIIQLLDGNDVPVAQTETDENGQYAFWEVAPGNYRIKVIAPSGFGFAPADQGSDDASDSDVSSAGLTGLFPVVAGEVLTNLDAGLVPLTLSVNDVTVTEGHSGTTDAVFTVTLSAPSPAVVTVDYATAPGTASAGTDFTSTSGTLTFAPGETVKTIAVPVVGDTTQEDDETFTVSLSAPVHATIADGTGQGTIQDDDTLVSIADLSFTDGDSGWLAVMFTVSLSAPSDFPITVDYATADGTAVAGSDYIAASGTLTLLPGETSQHITVTILGDMTYELDEDFFIHLGAATNASIADGVARGVIENDDSPPTLMIYVTGVAEGDSGTTVLTFTISLGGLSALPVTVDYATSAAPYDSATAGTDYQATSGTLTFNPGQTEKTVNVVVYADTDWENDEWVLLDLFNAVGADLGTTQAWALILNDDW